MPRFFRVTALIFASALFCIAQPPPPKTVLEYYRLLPDKHFEADREQRINWLLDPKRGAIVDSKNGYLFAPGDGAQTEIYLSLFKKRNVEFVVAVKHHDSDTNDSSNFSSIKMPRGPK